MAFSANSSSAVATEVAVVAGGGGGGGGGVQYLKAHLAHDLVQFLVWIESIKQRPEIPIQHLDRRIAPISGCQLCSLFSMVESLTTQPPTKTP